jgi:hypothetical protein
LDAALFVEKRNVVLRVKLKLEADALDFFNELVCRWWHLHVHSYITHGVILSPLVGGMITSWPLVGASISGPYHPPLYCC